MTGKSIPHYKPTASSGWAPAAFLFTAILLVTSFLSAQNCTVTGCDDSSACTVDTCDQATGVCTFDLLPLDGSACDDGLRCTDHDTCRAGRCTGLPKCNDGNACNGVEGCDESTGLCFSGMPLPAGTACTDLDPCTVGDVCNAGICTGTPRDCDDGDACNGAEMCEAGTGACLPGPFLADGVVCTPRDACVENAVCTGGLCTGPRKNCDDGKACTVDLCDAFGTCLNTVACSDGNPCTTDECDPAGDCSSRPKCDDGDPCTRNLCDGAGNCSYLRTACDDGNACTIDTCDGNGACLHVAVNTDDGNLCTEDLCSRGTVLNIPRPAGTPCGGGNSCDSFGNCGSVTVQLTGPWPQASASRFTPTAEVDLAEKYQLWRHLAGTRVDPNPGDFGTPGCARLLSCTGTCGISHESRINKGTASAPEFHWAREVYVVAPNDDVVYVAWDYAREERCEDPTAACQPVESKILRLPTTLGGAGLDLAGAERFQLANRLSEISDLLFPQEARPLLDFAVDDLLYVDTSTGGPQLVLLVWFRSAFPQQPFFFQGTQALIALDPQTWALSWVIRVSDGNVPFTTRNRRRNRVNVAPGGHFLVQVAEHGGRSLFQGTLYRASPPRTDLGERVENGIPIDLPGRQDPHEGEMRLLDFALDDSGRLYTLFEEATELDGCRQSPVLSTRLRIFSERYDRLLLESNTAVSSRLGPRVVVERALEAQDTQYRAVVLGPGVWPNPDCEPLRNQFKTPYQFTEDEHHPEYCPARLAAACAQRFPPPPPAHGNCCLPHLSAGCSNPQIEQAVCDVRPRCCLLRGWDEDCVNLVPSCPAIDASATDCHCQDRCEPVQCPFNSIASGDVSAAEVHQFRLLPDSGLLEPVYEKAIHVPQTLDMRGAGVSLDGYGNMLAADFDRVYNLLEEGPPWRMLGTEGASGSVFFGRRAPGANATPFVIAPGTTVTFRLPNITTGRAGDIDQLIGRLFLRRNTAHHPQGKLYPVGGQRLLLASTESLHLLLPSPDFALGRDLPQPSADDPIPTVPMCPDTLCNPASPTPCYDDAVCEPGFDLDIEVDGFATGELTPEPDPPTFRQNGWLRCLAAERVYLQQQTPPDPPVTISTIRNATFPECNQVELRKRWEAENVVHAFTSGVPGRRVQTDLGSIRRKCVTEEFRPVPEVSVVPIVQNRFQRTERDYLYLRCTTWREVHNTRRGEQISGIAHIFPVIPDDDLFGEPACTELTTPVPYRALRLDGRFSPRVRVRDTSGRETSSAGVGETISLSIEGLPPGREARFLHHSGLATVAGANVLTVTPRAPGTVLVQPQNCAPGGAGCVPLRHGLDSEFTLIQAAGPPSAPRCTLFGDKYYHCDVPSPIPVVAAPEWPSRNSPAEAGIGVQLYDLSFEAHVTDHTILGFGFPVLLSRSYRSSHQPLAGGLLGGWTFGLDQRITPVRRDPARGLWDADDDGLDVALQDGTGYVSVFRYPSFPAGHTITPTVFSDTGAEFYVYRPGAGLQRRDFTAKVVTYESPKGVFSTLRSYTLLPALGQIPWDVHPYAPPSTGGTTASDILPTHQRFYELTSPNGDRRIFGADGQLLRIIDAQYREVELVYGGDVHPLTGAPRLTAIIDTHGRTHSVRWTTVGGIPRISRVEEDMPNRRRRWVNYYYRPFGLQGALLDGVVLSFINFDNGDEDVSQTWRYRYNDQGLLTTIIEPGFTEAEPLLVNDYTDKGEVREQILGNPAADTATGDYAAIKEGGSFRFRRDSASVNGVIVTDPKGTVFTYDLAPAGGDPNAPLAIASVSYQDEIYTSADPADINPQRQTATITTSFDYYDTGLLKTKTRPDQTTLDYEYNDLGQLTSFRQPAGAAGDRRTTTTGYERLETSDGRLRCSLVQRYQEPGLEPVVYRYFPFDPAAPGRACQIRRIEPPPAASTGQSYTFTEEYNYVASSPLRGALTLHAVQSPADKDDPPTSPDDYETASGARVLGLFYQPAPEPTLAQVSAARSGKVRFRKLGHLRESRQKGARPQQCDPSAELERRSILETDDRGNIIRSTLLRPGGDLVTTYAHDMKDRLRGIVRDPDGFAASTTYEYSPRDQLLRESSVQEDHFDPALFGGLIPAQPEITVEKQNLFNRLGRRYAHIEGAVGAARSVTLTGYDALGNAVASLAPGAGAALPTASGTVPLDQLLADLDAGNYTVRELFVRHGVKNAANNFANDSGGPVARNPKFVETRYTFDRGNRLISSLTTDGGDRNGLCPGALDCAASHQVRTEYYRDALGRVRIVDTGRTDRADPNGQTGRVFRRWTYTPDDLLSTEQLVDPGGCSGAATVVRATTYLYDTPLPLPTTIEIRGDDGQVRQFATSSDLQETAQCRTDELLSKTVLGYDNLGNRNLREDWQYQVGADNPATPPKLVTRNQHDYESRVTEITRSAGQANAHETERFAYNHAGDQCWEAELPGAGITAGNPIRESRSMFDQAGLIVRQEEVHHETGLAAGGPIEIRKRFRHDSLFRVMEDVQELGSGGELASAVYYDSFDQPRVVQDPDGILTETRYDAMARAVYTARHSANAGSRGKRFLLSPGGLTLRESTFYHPPGAAEQVRSIQRFDYDVRGNAVRIYPYGVPDTQFIEQVYNETGQILWRKDANGIEFLYESDAFGLANQIEAHPPTTLPDGFAPPEVLSTRLKQFRYNGVGQLAIAKNFGFHPSRGSPVPIATVLTQHDSLGNVQQERQEHHFPQYSICDPDCAADNYCIARECVADFLVSGSTKRSSTAQVASRYDERGYLDQLNYDVLDAASPTLDYSIDGFGRIYQITPVANVPRLERIVYGYKGDFAVEREVWHPATGGLERATYQVNELGQRYQIEYNTGWGYTHRKYWRGTRMVYSTSKVDLVKHPDPAIPLVGKSHFGGTLDWRGCRDPYQPGVPDIYQQRDDYNDYPGHPWASTIQAHCFDDLGSVVYSLATTYAAGNGKPSLHGTWRRMEGNRLVWEQSSTYDPRYQWDLNVSLPPSTTPSIPIGAGVSFQASKYPLDVRHLSFTYGGQNPQTTGMERIVGLRHRTLKNPRQINHLRQLPLQPAPSGDDLFSPSGALTPNATESFEFDHTSSGQMTSDGRLLSFTNDDTPTPPPSADSRYLYQFDLFGQLVRVVDRVPGICDTGPPFVQQRVAPLAGSMRVFYDALNRRIEVDYPLPDGCAGRESRAVAESPRRFFYRGTRLLTEVVYSRGGNEVAAKNIYVWGIEDDLPYVGLTGFSRTLISPEPGVPATLEWRYSFLPFEDLDGSFIGFLDLATNAQVFPFADYPHYRSYPRFQKGPWEIPFRRVSTTAEREGFGNLTYVDGLGYILDNRQNRVSGFWHAEEDYNEMVFISRLQSAVEVVNALSVAFSAAPIVGDLAGLVADAANIGFQLYVQGPSLEVLPEALAAVGATALSVTTIAAGPPGRAGAAGLRAARSTRAVNALGKMADTASQVRAATATRAASRTADGKNVAARTAGSVSDVSAERRTLVMPGGGCLTTCFAAGTAVHTPTGARAIERILPGDLVLARDPSTGATLPARVLETYSRSAGETVRVAIAAPDGAEEVLQVTPEHPFFVQGEGWVQAGDLRAGNDLGELRGDLRVTSVSPGTSTAVYNFAVADSHTYFAGVLGAWVHNASSSQLVCGLRDDLRQARENLRQRLKAANLDEHEVAWIVDEGATAAVRVDLDVAHPYVYFTTARAGPTRNGRPGVRGALGDLPPGFVDHKTLGLTGEETRSILIDQVGGFRHYGLYHAEPKVVQTLPSLVVAEFIALRRVTGVHILIDKIPCSASCSPGLGLVHPVAAGPVTGGFANILREAGFTRATSHHIHAVPGTSDPANGYFLLSYIQ